MLRRQHRIESEHAADVVARAGGGIDLERLARQRSRGVAGGVAAAVDAVEPADEGDAGGAVGIVLDPLDDAHGGRCGVALEVDGSVEALGSAAAVEGGYAAGGVPAGGLAGSEGELPKCSLHRRHCLSLSLCVCSQRSCVAGSSVNC